ncbi:hypothetical protein BB776_05590 [Planococcus salinarum]|uniref:Transposase n=1 Tax=Planococcus salinarum TaxID=622695 RepID=A0ABX3D2T6_9BACL|nr:hypothetical protein [Planococcus salinarum]OHX55231.1 hypothetical protein BB776_05590 [Planococcus salinarum]TAA72364.1 hypothetical protein D2909_06275 [Planococcus salinarum]
MDVDTVLNLYIFFLAAAAVLCMVIAWFVTRISENLFIGFVSIFIASLLSLMLIFGWFQSMTLNAAEETIHWVFSYGLVLLLYPIYLFMNWFILKRARRFRAEE